MTIKRDRSEMESDLTAVNGLILLSKAEVSRQVDGRVFSCKTCNRTFPSFQALGGHRASHKKIPKLLPSSSAAESSSSAASDAAASPPKPKTHECSICGLEFAIGQALGGHMRRHRQQIADHAASAAAGVGDADRIPIAAAVVPVLKKSNSSKRVCLELDLDLHLGPPGSYYSSAGRDNLKLQLTTPLC